MVEIVDVSVNQAVDTDWDKVKAAGVDGVIVKATEGVDYVDPHFYSHVLRASQAGLQVMAYHYLRVRSAIEQDSTAQIREFCKTVQSAGLPARVAIDCETAENGEAHAAEWISAIRPAVIEATVQMCVAPMIYTSRGEWVSMGGVILATASDLSACPLWLAAYNDHPIAPAPWEPDGWTFHQYTGTGRVDGIHGEVDRSRYRGTLDELRVFLSG